MADEQEQDSIPLSQPALDVIEELAQRAESRQGNCIELSELSEVVQEHELEDDEAQAVHETLEQRGYELHDDCGKTEERETSYSNGELAERTTDAMALFLREVARHPLLTGDQEVELAKRIERGDL